MVDPQTVVVAEVPSKRTRGESNGASESMDTTVTTVEPLIGKLDTAPLLIARESEE